MGAFGGGAIVASLIGGQLADQIGRRVVMLFALFGGAAMLIVIGRTESKWALITSIFVFGVINDMYRPAASAMIGDLVAPARRGEAFSLMYIAINLGFACGPPIGGFLSAYSFSWLFWGDALTTAAYGMIVAIVIRETLPKVPPRPVAVDDSDDAPTGSDENARVSIIDAARHILHDGTFILFCFATLAIAIVFMQALSTLPIFMRSCDIDNETIGGLLAINGVMIVVFQLPVTRWWSRFNRMTAIMVGGILVGLGTGATAFADVWWAFIPTIMVWTTGEISQAPFTHAVVTDLAPVALRGRYMGLFSVTFSTSILIGAPLGGEILSRFGGRALWLSCLLSALVAVSLYGMIYRRVTARSIADAS
jgi:MFS family permease